MKTTYLLVLLQFSCGSTVNKSKALGDFRSSFVHHEYLLTETNTQWYDVRDSTLEWSPIWRNKSYTRNQISWKIYSVSTCLDIDPIIYSSLIYSESAYMSDAQSVTGAVGLSQFTNIGILEVNDQLGMRGMEYAREDTYKYFQTVIRNCISHQNGIFSYKNLWTFSDQKRRLLLNADHSLIYGAIYLKLMLSVARSRIKSTDIDTLYRIAIENYNGDPPIKKAYAEGIIRRSKIFYSGLR